MPIAEQTVVIRPDFSRFSSELSQGLSALPDLIVKVSADVSALSDQVSSAVDGLAEVQVAVAADTTAVEDAISTISADDITVEVDGDTTAVEAAISSISADDITVEVDGDTTAVEDAISSISADDVIISVDADTSAFEAATDAAIADVESKAAEVKVEASGGGGGADISGLVGAARGANLDSISTSLAGIGGASAAATAGIGAFAAGAVVAFNSAKEAAEVARQAVAVFGDSASKLDKVSFDGFTGSLQEAGEALGVDDEAIKRFETSVGRALQGAGLNAKDFAGQIANIGPQLTAIALEAGKSIEEMDSLIQTAILKGGKRSEDKLARLGIQVELEGLDSEAARANAIFDAVAAKGSKSFENMADAPERALDRLKAQIGNTFEELGTSLVPLVASLAESLAPLIAGFGELAAIVTKIMDNPIAKFGLKLAVETSALGQLGKIGEFLDGAPPKANAVSSAFGTITGKIGEAADAAAKMGEAANKPITIEVDVSEATAALETFRSATADSFLAKNISAKFGVEVDTSSLATVGEKIGAIGTEIAATVAAKWPKFGDIFKEVFSKEDTQSLDEFANTFKQKMADFAQFGARIKELTQAGFGDLAGLLAQQGPAAAEAVNQLFDAAGNVIPARATQLSADISTGMASAFAGLKSLAEAGFAQFEQALTSGVGGGSEILLSLGLDTSDAIAAIAAVKGTLAGEGFTAHLKAQLPPDTLSSLQATLTTAALTFDAKVKTDPAGAAAELNATIQAALNGLPPGTFKTTADKDAAAASLAAAVTAAAASAPPADIKAATGAVDTRTLDDVNAKPIDIPVTLHAPTGGNFLSDLGYGAGGAQTITQTVTIDVVGEEKLATLKEPLPNKTQTISVNVTGGEAVASAKAAIAGLDSKRVSVEVNAGAAKSTIDGVKSALEGIRDKKVEVQAQTSAALDGIRAVDNALDGLRDKRIDVSTNAASAVSGINSLKTAIDSLRDKTITINVNQTGGSIPGASTGGVFQPQPGGRLINIAEAGYAEVVIPLDPAQKARQQQLLAAAGLLPLGEVSTAGALTGLGGSTTIVNIGGLAFAGGTSIPLEDVGRETVAGLADGIRSGLKQAEDAFTDLAAIGPQVMRDTLDIRSPSQVTFDVGFEAAAGLAEGITAGTALVTEAATAMASGAVAGTTAAVIGAGSQLGEVLIGSTVNEMAQQLGRTDLQNMTPLEMARALGLASTFTTSRFNGQTVTGVADITPEELQRAILGEAAWTAQATARDTAIRMQRAAHSLAPPPDPFSLSSTASARTGRGFGAAIGSVTINNFRADPDAVTDEVRRQVADATRLVGAIA